MDEHHLAQKYFLGCCFIVFAFLGQNEEVHLLHSGLFFDSVFALPTVGIEFTLWLWWVRRRFFFVSHFDVLKGC